LPYPEVAGHAALVAYSLASAAYAVVA